LIRVAYILESFDLAGAEKSVFHIVKFINRAKFTPVMISLEVGGKLEKEFDIFNIEHYVINTGSLLSIKGMIKFYKIINHLNIDIIHSNTLKSHIQSRLIGFFFNNKKIISTYRNEPQWLKSKQIRNVIRKLLDRFTARFFSDMLTFVSYGTFKFFKMNGFHHSKTEVVYNSIDTELIENIKFSKKDIMKDFNVKENEIVIVAIGRLTEQKGFEYLFPAINEVAKEVRNIKFLIFGEDQSSGYYKKLLSKYNFINVLIIDSYTNILQVLSCADIFVSSSLWEGLPRGHLESLLCGCPVISTNIGGSNEVIKHEYNGILVTPRNSNEIINAIYKILNSQKMVESFKYNGYKILKDKFDIKKNTIKIENLYLSLYND